MAFSSRIHAGFQWLLDPDHNPETDDAPDIVNNSWGFDDDPNLCNDLSKEFQDDIQAMKAAGMVVIFAAGNTGPEAGTSTAPANYPQSFAVGSVGTFSSPALISSFSARGPSACDATIYPEVVAPGFQSWTSDLTTGGVIPDSYIMVSGTSFSAAHASGVMALLLSAFPEALSAVLETTLKQSATDLGDTRRRQYLRLRPGRFPGGLQLPVRSARHQSDGFDQPGRRQRTRLRQRGPGR